MLGETDEWGRRITEDCLALFAESSRSARIEDASSLYRPPFILLFSKEGRMVAVNWRLDTE